MKKSVIIVVVGLLALILFLQYKQRKNAVPMDISGNTAVQGSDGLPAGVPLPTEATAYAAPSSTNSRPATFTPSAPALFVPPAAMAGRGPIATIPSDFAKSSIYPGGGSLNDILAAHGKTWGYSAFNPGSFTKEENDAVYGLLAKYFSCTAVAYGKMEMCNYVPGVQNVKIDKYFTTPNYQCMDPAVKVLFYGYAAGKFQSAKPCFQYFKGDNVAGARVPPDFCEGAGQGFDFVCNHKDAGKNKARCHEAFPSSREDCKSSECLDNFSLYSALKDNNMSGCPENYMSECSAFFTKSPSICSVILEKLGGIYYPTLAAHEQSDSKEMVKKREAALKKEEQKLQDEINKKAKKALGKE